MRDVLIIQGELYALLQALGPQSVFTVADNFNLHTGRKERGESMPDCAVWEQLHFMEEKGVVWSDLSGTHRVYRLVE